MSNSKGMVRLWGLSTILNGEGEGEKGSGETNDFLEGGGWEKGHLWKINGISER